MGMIVTIDPDAPHPGRENATACTECGREAVFFNEGNVTVQCHNCGAQDFDHYRRQFHLDVYRKDVLKEPLGLLRAVEPLVRRHGLPVTHDLLLAATRETA